MTIAAKVFKTTNLAVCAFLQLQGLKYVRADLSLGKYDKSVVEFVFEDPRGIGRDLELDFARSEFKAYRDLFFFFRNEIEKIKRKLDKINHDEIRKNDIKYFGENKE